MPPRWIHEPQDTALMLGNAVVINCEADGYPVTEITWLKGGNRAKTCIFRFVLCCNNTLIGLLFSVVRRTEGKSSKEFKSIQLRNSSLTVDYVTDDDEGYYMCTANNGIGSGLKKIIHINVNGKRNNAIMIEVKLIRQFDKMLLHWTKSFSKDFERAKVQFSWLSVDCESVWISFVRIIN